MSLESGFHVMDELEWELGGLLFSELAEVGDDGLDDGSEVEGEDEDGAGDGGPAVGLRLVPRSVTLTANVPNVDEDGNISPEVFAASLNEIRKVTSPLPDRHATRLLRFRRLGEVAKRIAVQPALGKPITVPGDFDRLVHSHALVQIRLTAPDPIIVSDDLHSQAFTAGATHNIVNAGSFTAVNPTAWELTSSTAVVLENLDFDEYIRFPLGPVTVKRNRGIFGPAGAYGVAYGENGSLYPRWPLLRPGDNDIKASAACTLTWRDTW